MKESREQRLVNICFQLVMKCTDADVYPQHFKGKTVEEKSKWVRENLRLCGFPTSPCGMSHGLLDEE